MRGYSICLFINFFVCLVSKGQQTPTDTTKNKQPLTKNSRKSFSALSSIYLPDSTGSRNNIIININTIPAHYYTSTIGFFCRKELEVEKALKFPVKFRLGSVDYTDKMEGKGTGTLFRNLK